MLTYLIRETQNPNPTPEDNLENAVGLLFPDNVRTFHGDAGSKVTYFSKRFGDIELSLSETNSQEEHVLFAHHIWNAGIQMSEFISQANDPTRDKRDGTWNAEEESRWNVEGETVLEVGAGTGIVGITAALAGAKEVILSDYPSRPILANLHLNVKKNIPSPLHPLVSIHPHEWGILTDPFSLAHAGHFTRILCADCIWADGEHYGLALSIAHFLSPAPHARAWVIAGFHTGRAKLVAFFDILVGEGLEVEGIWERDAGGMEREWRREREGGEEGERNRWMVVGIFKRRGDGVVEERVRRERYLASMMVQKGNRHV